MCIFVWEHVYVLVYVGACVCACMCESMCMCMYVWEHVYVQPCVWSAEINAVSLIILYFVLKCVCVCVFPCIHVPWCTCRGVSGQFVGVSSLLPSRFQGSNTSG